MSKRRKGGSGTCPECGHSWDVHCPAHMEVTNGCRASEPEGTEIAFGVRVCGCRRQRLAAAAKNLIDESVRMAIVYAARKREWEAEEWIGKVRAVAEREICSHKKELGPKARIVGIDTSENFGIILVGDPKKNFRLHIPFAGLPEIFLWLFRPLQGAGKRKDRKKK